MRLGEAPSSLSNRKRYLVVHWETSIPIQNMYTCKYFYFWQQPESDFLAVSVTPKCILKFGPDPVWGWPVIATTQSNLRWEWPVMTQQQTLDRGSSASLERGGNLMVMTDDSITTRHWMPWGSWQKRLPSGRPKRHTIPQIIYSSSFWEFFSCKALSQLVLCAVGEKDAVECESKKFLHNMMTKTFTGC